MILFVQFEYCFHVLLLWNFSDYHYDKSKVPTFVFLALNSCSTIVETREDLHIQPKTVVLTFDDGPCENPSVDNELLDLLASYNIKAYFCLIGEKAKKNPEIVKRLTREHHVVNHTMNHAITLFWSSSDFIAEFDRFDNTISGIIGLPFHADFFRPPAGFLNDSIVDLEKEGVIRLLRVTHVPNDTFVDFNHCREYMEALIIEIEKKEGGIIVLHDGYEGPIKPTAADLTNPAHSANREWLVRETDFLIRSLRNDGFKFVEL